MKMMNIILLMFLTLTVFSQTEKEVKMFNLMNDVRQNPKNNAVVVALDSTIKSYENQLTSLNKRLTPVKIGNMIVKQKIDSMNIMKTIELVNVYLIHLRNTKEFLKNVSPVKALVFDKTMYDSYKNYDISKTKGLKHTDVYKKAENMVVVQKDPVIALMNLIVDFPYGIGEKGHRDNIFNTKYTKACVFENTTTLSEVTYIQGFK